MNIYNYDPVTFEFLGVTTARENPKEPGEHLVPAHATTVETSEPDEGYVRVFDTEAETWSTVEDNRGDVVYRKSDATKVVVDWLGEVGSDYTDLVPGPKQDWSGTEWIDPEPENADQITAEVSAHVRYAVSTKGYDSPETLQSYVNSTNPLWRAEANTFIAWRDGVWTYVYEQIALWENGERTITTADELVDELDAIVWPSEGDYVPALVKQSILSNLSVDSGIVATIVSSSGVSGAFRESEGVYWILFAQEEPDTNYIINSYDGGSASTHAPYDLKATTHCIIHVEDASGNPVDPEQINIEVKRIT